MGKVFFVILGIALALSFFNAVFVVDETQQVIVTQFGKVIGEPFREPGLKFKLPWIQKANYFPKNLLNWDGDSGQIPTLDKTFIYVETFARWRIVEPLLFFQTVITVENALARLDDIIDASVRNLITSYPLIETVRMTNRELDTFEAGFEKIQDTTPLGNVETGREKISEAILEQARPKLESFGIELLDVKIKRINYVQEVREKVYDRMIAEREQIAEKFRNEGQGETRRIEGETEKELKRIESEAYRTAQEIMGKADAEAAAIYAASFGRDSEFYSFVRSLEIYKETMDEKSTLVLSTDSEFLKYLKGPMKAEDEPAKGRVNYNSPLVDR